MNAEVRQRLSQAVRVIRGTRSQRRFAKDLGVSYATVRSWEACESLPGLESLEAIAGARSETLEEFLAYLRGEPVEKPKPQVAEDLMPMVEQLSRGEVARLAQIIVGRLAGSKENFGVG